MSRSSLRQPRAQSDYHTIAAAGRLDWGPSMSPVAQEFELNLIASMAPPLVHRALICYVNFHFLNSTMYGKVERKAALEKVPKSLVYTELRVHTRYEFWRMQSLTVFALSPAGGGYDCHRTWEALALGSIPIVRTSPIDAVYAGLPVLIVQDWANVTEDLLLATRSKFARLKWDRRRLTLAFWTERIRTVAAKHRRP